MKRRRPLDYQRFRQRLLTVLLAIAVLAAIAAAWGIHASYQAQRDAALTRTQAFVPGIEAHVAHTLSLVDYVLSGQARAIETMQREDATPGAVRRLLAAPAAMNQDFQVLFLDRSGDVVASSDAGQALGKSYAGHEFFTIHLTRQRDLFVGAPFVDANPSRRVFMASRRVESADGAFLGVLAAPVSADAIAAFFSAARHDDAASVTLVHLAGRVVARSPMHGQSFGADVSGAVLFDSLRSAPTGNYRSTSLVDKGGRVYSYRTLAGLPLAVTVGMSSDAWTKALERNLLLAAVAAGVVALAMLAGARFTLRAYARLERSEKRYRELYVDVREAKSSLAASERRLRLVANNLPVLIGHVDKTESFSFANRMCEEIYGVPHDKVIGMPARELLGDAGYAQSQPYIRTVMEGTSVHFERVVARQGGERWEDVNYVPDVQPDGSVAGYFVMVEDITERKTAQTLVWRQANYDQLTGLPNRGMFIERLRHELSARGRWPQSMAILFIDLDGFKAVNDTHGHASGDLLLKQAAARMQRALRETDMVARLAGDEFTVLLAGVQGRPDADRIARVLLAALSAPFALDGREVSVSASAGISFAPEDSDDADELLKQADQAMYRAKRDGRCGLAFHRPATTVQPRREGTDVPA